MGKHNPHFYPQGAQSHLVDRTLYIIKMNITRQFHKREKLVFSVFMVMSNTLIKKEVKIHLSLFIFFKINLGTFST